MKKFALGLLVLMLSFGLVMTASAEAFAPPGHGGTPPGQEMNGENPEDEENLPPGLRGKEAPPGLQKKDGLPPGMEKKEVLPPGIQMRFWHTLQERERKAQEEMDSLEIQGENSVALPADDETVEEQYKAVALCEEGEEVQEVDADWSLENGDNEIEGVSITEDGLLEVTDEAAAGNITIFAEFIIENDNDNNGERTLSAELEVDLYEAEIDSIVIEGYEFFAITGDEELIALDYTASVRDQNEKEMKEETVSWDVYSEDFDDIEIDEEGKVTIDDPAEGLFTVEAVSDTDEDISQELEVTVYIPEPSDVEVVSGAETIVIPEEEEDEVVEEYSAVVVDQHGFEMEEEEVVWFLVEVNDEDGIVEEDSEVPGVTLTGEGVLTVTGEAEEGEINLLAVYYEDENDEEGLFAYFEVELLEEAEEENEEE